jgi:hypothetical protein
MQATHGTQIGVLLIALGIVAFWRAVLKWVIILLSTAIIATLSYGAIMAWHSMHHVAG